MNGKKYDTRWKFFEEITQLWIVNREGVQYQLSKRRESCHSWVYRTKALGSTNEISPYAYINSILLITCAFPCKQSQAFTLRILLSYL